MNTFHLEREREMEDDKALDPARAYHEAMDSGIDANDVNVVRFVLEKFGNKWIDECDLTITDFVGADEKLECTVRIF